MPRVVITKGAKFRKELVFTDADILTIGRAHTSDIVLPDPSRRVSRYQAAIIRAPGPQERYFLRDLSSLRPTKVRGEAVSQKLLQDGDVITIAGYELVYFQTAGEAEEEEDVALIVVRQKEDDKAAQRGADLTWKSTVLLTHQELLKEIPLVPERREVVEALLSRARAVSTLGDLFEVLQEPILRVLSATRGFVGLFRDGYQGTYSGVGVRGFDPKKGERIAISDAAFLERLQQGEYVQERTTLLVPLRLRDEAVGFFCLDRQPPADSFTPEDVEFLSLLGRLATALIGVGTPGRKREQREVEADEVLEWPMAMVGKSPKMQEVYRQIADAAATDGNVLLIGETGTGKELVAQAIHRQSSHAKGPFIQMNCGAIPETLAESEFFGYVARSGIAGADPNGAPGKFELAHGGAWLLDEIEAMSLAIQAKCLRVLEEKKVWRLGARAPVSVAVKVMAVTNEDLGQAVDSGRFRKDLSFRFGQQIRVPPLRERKDDIPLLVHYFLDKYARHDRKRARGLSHTAAQRLINYHWPGNVRELRDVIRNAVSRDTEVLFSWDFPPAIRQGVQEPEKTRPKSKEEVEKAHILEALEYTRGNKNAAHQILGYRSRQTLLNKMDIYGIPRDYGTPRDEGPVTGNTTEGQA